MGPKQIYLRMHICAVPGRITGEREVRTTFRGARMVHQVCGYKMAYLRVVQTVHHSLWTASRKPSENGSENTAFWTLWWARRPLWTILLWIRWLTMYPPTWWTILTLQVMDSLLLDVGQSLRMAMWPKTLKEAERFCTVFFEVWSWMLTQSQLGAFQERRLGFPKRPYFPNSMKIATRSVSRRPSPSCQKSLLRSICFGI